MLKVVAVVHRLAPCRYGRRASPSHIHPLSLPPALVHARAVRLTTPPADPPTRRAAPDSTIRDRFVHPRPIGSARGIHPRLAGFPQSSGAGLAVLDCHAGPKLNLTMRLPAAYKRSRAPVRQASGKPHPPKDPTKS
jgi:hypothetical protein